MNIRIAILISLPPMYSMLASAQEALAPTGSDSGYSYTPTNKRDPFKPPLKFEETTDEGLPAIQRYTLDQLKLTTILWNSHDSQMISRVMFRDPKGRSYVLKEGDRIGKNFGVIFRINKQECIVAEKFKDPFGNESIQETTIVLSDAKGKP